jgi:hypothetical protein
VLARRLQDTALDLQERLLEAGLSKGKTSVWQKHRTRLTTLKVSAKTWQTYARTS